MSTFQERIFDILRSIPKGSVLTYKQVATEAGNPKASRAVGRIIGTNYNPEIPCHRVVRSDGGLGGYNRGLAKKKALLISEGVVINNNKVML